MGLLIRRAPHGGRGAIAGLNGTAGRRAAAGAAVRSGRRGGLLRVLADDNRPDDEGDLIRWQAGPPRVFADRLRVGRLVDADAAEPAVLFLDHITADPADAVRHLF